MGKEKAGCVPVRRLPDSTDWQVLLVQSRWTPEIWLFPKGTVEDDEKAKEAAVRETVEEGGVEGELGPKLGTWHINKGSKVKQKMWLLYVKTEYGPDNKKWKERKKRLRGWYTLAEAKSLFTAIPDDLKRPELVEMLDAATIILEQIGTGEIPVGPSNGEIADSTSLDSD